jgi:hypothetical protein
MNFISGAYDVVLGAGDERKTTGDTREVVRTKEQLKLFHQSRKAELITQSRRLWKVIPVFIRLNLPLGGPISLYVYI